MWCPLMQSRNRLYGNLSHESTMRLETRSLYYCNYPHSAFPVLSKYAWPRSISHVLSSSLHHPPVFTARVGLQLSLLGGIAYFPWYLYTIIWLKPTRRRASGYLVRFLLRAGSAHCNGSWMCPSVTQLASVKPDLFSKCKWGFPYYQGSRQMQDNVSIKRTLSSNFIWKRTICGCIILKENMP